MVLSYRVRKQVEDEIGKENMDTVDVNAYSSDTPFEQVAQDYGFTGKSIGQKMRDEDAHYRQLLKELRQSEREEKQERKGLAKKEWYESQTKGANQILSSSHKKKSKTYITVEDTGEIYKYKKGFNPQKNEIDTSGTTIFELNKLIKQKEKASKEVKAYILNKEKADLQKNMPSINKILKQASRNPAKEAQRANQKLRSDRLAKKELRAAELKSRLNRLQKAERTQMRVQRRIARILNRKKQVDLVSATEYRAMYGRPNTQNDGNLLHTPNLFTSNDGRERSNKTSGNILQAPNYLMKYSKQRTKWI